jgi:hypothetical protein
MKLTQLRMNKASEYVKMEKIQAIIDMNWPRPLVKKKSQPVDTYIENMLKKVFGDDVPYDVYDAKTKKDVSKTVVVDARVDKGKIKVLQFVPRDIASILGGTVSGRHGRGENANAAYSPHGLAQGI